MRVPLMLTFAGAALLAALLGAPSLATARSTHHFNPVIDLLATNRPVFGLYAPANPRAGRRGAPQQQAKPAASKSQAELAREALAYKLADFTFSGSMEGPFDAAFPDFAAYMKGLQTAGDLQSKPFPHLAMPMIVKVHKVAEDSALAAQRIAKQLNTGVVGIMFPETESANEVREGLAAMRFKSEGGTRPDNVGDAPAVWGMTEKEYKQKADLWPLNPKGELVNWTIVESKEGLANVRQIAAVPGIGVLWPGAGTLRGVFTDTVNGKRVFNQAGWEGAIQQVLAACKEFHVACGFPARDSADIAMRMKQGFTVFVMNWGEPGQKTIEAGRAIGGRKAGDTGSTYKP